MWLSSSTSSAHAPQTLLPKFTRTPCSGRPSRRYAAHRITQHIYRTASPAPVSHQWPTHHHHQHATTSMLAVLRTTTSGPANQQDGPDVVDLKTASMLLLVTESFKRATDRTLVPTQDLLKVPGLVDNISCAVLLIEPQQAPSSSGPNHNLNHLVTYANGPARTLLFAPTSNRWGSTANPDPVGVSNSAPAGPLAHVIGSTLDQVLEEALPDEAMQYPYLAPGQAPGWRWIHGCRFRTSTPGGGSDIAVASCVVCDVASPTGRVLGKVLIWDQWSFPSDDRVGRPGVPAIQLEQAPSQSDVDAAQTAVRTQADHVKSLKTTGGKTNQDVEVQEAVAQLQALKQAAAHLERLRSVYVLDQTQSPLHGLVGQ